MLKSKISFIIKTTNNDKGDFVLKVNRKGVATQLQQNAGNVMILVEQNFALKIVQRAIREILCNIALDSNLIFRQTKKQLKFTNSK